MYIARSTAALAAATHALHLDAVVGAAGSGQLDQDHAELLAEKWVDRKWVVEPRDPAYDRHWASANKHDRMFRTDRNGDGQYYAFTRGGNIPYDDGVQACLNNSMRIAAPASPEDNEVLKEYLNDGWKDGEYWIDVNHRTETPGGLWKVNGKLDPAWTNWAHEGSYQHGQPSYVGEWCAVLSSEDMLWYESTCIEQQNRPVRGVVCERYWPDEWDALVVQRRAVYDAAQAAAKGYYNFVVPEGLLWHEAVSVCESHNKQIASIASQAEQDVVTGLVYPENRQRGHWLGGVDQNAEKTSSREDWSWLSGDRWSYTRWGGNPPMGGNHHTMMHGGPSSNWSRFNDEVDWVTGVICMYR